MMSPFSSNAVDGFISPDSTTMRIRNKPKNESAILALIGNMSQSNIGNQLRIQ
jgi:hypothetical protein